jgi:hypothetical protein
MAEGIASQGPRIRKIRHDAPVGSHPTKIGSQLLGRLTDHMTGVTIIIITWAIIVVVEHL